MYTKQQFGKELKEQMLKNKTSEEIGAWSIVVYYARLFEMDTKLGLLLLQLGAMEEGYQFERSYEELNDIADRLIAGEDVELWKSRFN